MKKTMLWAMLPLLLGAMSAVAQTGGGSSVVPKNPTTSGPPAVQAPIGHRQPRASDFADEKSAGNPNDPMTKDEAALDRKIKNICRGC